MDDRVATPATALRHPHFDHVATAPAIPLPVRGGDFILLHPAQRSRGDGVGFTLGIELGLEVGFKGYRDVFKLCSSLLAALAWAPDQGPLQDLERVMVFILPESYVLETFVLTGAGCKCGGRSWSRSLPQSWKGAAHFF